MENISGHEKVPQNTLIVTQFISCLWLKMNKFGTIQMKHDGHTEVNFHTKLHNSQRPKRKADLDVHAKLGRFSH